MSSLLDGRSEVDLRNDILSGIAGENSLFPKGWYDPPPGGTSVLFGTSPFDRLKYETIRDPFFWPRESFRFERETVGFVYASSVDTTTGMMGDHGFTVYSGSDGRIAQHIRRVYETIYTVADLAQVGMKFSALYAEAMQVFRKQHVAIRWMTTHNDTQKTNLGHTVPGSFDGDDPYLGTFEEIKERITKGRIFINEIEDFSILPTCAFTVEARLVDTEYPELPNTFFHFIVTFSNGQKHTLSDFDDIFRDVGMSYML
ncbi:M24 family metallopeptidase [Candidatus Kaiserbacteria bacterium]|nr:M24 family metallopeptidase [Candidatus Kaiserbacteria bacterium]